jgi:tetratricopeptide (TPR) repeat protein
MKSWFLLTGVVVLSSSITLAAQQPKEEAVRRYSREAEEALARKDAGAAIEALEKLAQLTPNVAEVHANLGAVYYARGQYAQAAEAFRRALHLNPEIGNVLLMLAMCDAELGRAKEALPILEPAFRRPPNDQMGRTIGLMLVSLYSSQDQFPKALDATEELLRRYPDDPEVLYRASHLYGDRALQIMTRLVKVAPESEWKRMAFAEALEEEKRYDLAIIDYRKVVAADPDMFEAHYRLGRALLLKSPDSEEAREEALKEFQHELELDPRNSAAEYEIGETYRRRGQFEPALGHFARAVEIDPNVEDAQIAMARTLIHLQRPKESLAHLLAAIQLNPANEVSHFLLAGVYKSLGDAADYQHEMTLYLKYHSRPYAAEPAREEGAPSALTIPQVTKQRLDSEARQQP